MAQTECSDMLRHQDPHQILAETQTLRQCEHTGFCIMPASHHVPHCLLTDEEKGWPSPLRKKTINKKKKSGPGSAGAN